MMPNRVTSSRTLHAQRHAHPADRSNLTQTHHYHERLQRGNHVHASEGGARDPGASTTIIRSRRDGVETEVRAARSGATFSGVSETLLHQEQRTHSHATEHALYRRCCGKIQHAITCSPDLMYPLKELGRRLSNPRAADRKCLKHLLKRHPRNHGYGDGASSYARLEARPWQHRLPTRTGPDVTRRGSSRVVASPNGAW